MKGVLDLDDTSNSCINFWYTEFAEAKQSIKLSQSFQTDHDENPMQSIQPKIAVTILPLCAIERSIQLPGSLCVHLGAATLTKYQEWRFTVPLVCIHRTSSQHVRALPWWIPASKGTGALTINRHTKSTQGNRPISRLRMPFLAVNHPCLDRAVSSRSTFEPTKPPPLAQLPFLFYLLLKLHTADQENKKPRNRPYFSHHKPTNLAKVIQETLITKNFNFSSLNGRHRTCRYVCLSDLWAGRVSWNLCFLWSWRGLW